MDAFAGTFARSEEPETAMPIPEEFTPEHVEAQSQEGAFQPCLEFLR